MKQKFLIRYLILIGILLVCAGGVWFWSESSKTPSANAALVRVEESPTNSMPVRVEESPTNSVPVRVKESLINIVLA